MKNIFICYNYLTLYKAIYNIRNFYEANENIILYRNSVSKLPSTAKENFNIVEYELRKVKNKGQLNKYKADFNIMILNKQITKRIKHEIKKNQTNLIVFKDNGKIESTLIDRFKRITNNKGKVILIEEGIGLYKTILKDNMKKSIKKVVLQKLFNFSKYYMYDYPQGYNPRVDKIICSDKNSMKTLEKGKNIEIIQQTNIFSKKDVKFFIEKVLGYNNFDYDYLGDIEMIFLSQPLDDIGASLELEKKIINKLSSSSKKLLFKRHPRDKAKRDFENNQIVLYNFDDIPIECLYPFMNKPVIVTFYSSAYFNILNDDLNTRVILLYKIINKYVVNKLMKSIQNGRVKTPKNFDELENIMKNLYNL